MKTHELLKSHRKAPHYPRLGDSWRATVRVFPVHAVLAAVFVIGMLVAPRAVLSAWPVNIWPVFELPVCTESGDQERHTVVSDNSGGMIVVWRDSRGADADIYAQRVRADASIAWTTGGVPLCTAAGDQNHPRIASDGAGGAVVVWQDNRSLATSGEDIYAQRIDEWGTVLWGEQGMAVCDIDGYQGLPVLVADDSGGAIVVWADSRPGSNRLDMYAQHMVGSTGLPSWSENGIPVSVGTGDQGRPEAMPDGNGGAFVTWMDGRTLLHYDIYAQHVTLAGIPDWTLGGVAICQHSSSQRDPKMVSDGDGGAIIAWTDERSGETEPDIYAQRVTAAGHPVWNTDGVNVSWIDGATEKMHSITTDMAGGAIVVWMDTRNYGQRNYDIYAQRIRGSDGRREWTVPNSNGQQVCIAATAQHNPDVVSDGAGGAIVVWQDNRNEETQDIFAMHILNDGTRDPDWPANELPVSRAGGNQVLPTMMGEHNTKIPPMTVSDGDGGAIVAWIDDRNGPWDIYAQRIDPTSPLVRRNRWMEVMAQDIGDRPLLDITLPGTHDSGCYDLDRQFATDEVECRDTVYDGWSLPAGLGIENLVDDMGTTQSHNTLTQLRNGVRFFDLRVIDYNGTNRIYHDLVGPPLATILSDVATFMAEVNSELVILRFSGFCDEVNSGSHEEILAEIRIILEPHLYASEDEHAAGGLGRLTLNDFVAQGPRVLVLYENSYHCETSEHARLADGRRCIWWMKKRGPDDTGPVVAPFELFDSYANVLNVNSMINDQRTKLEAYSSTEYLYMVNWTVTAGPDDRCEVIICDQWWTCGSWCLGVEWHGLHDFTWPANQVLRDELPSLSELGQINVLNVDHYHESGVLEAAVLLNHMQPTVGVGSGDFPDDPGGANRLLVLHGASPNPFNPQTRITFSLAHSGQAQIAVYDLAGHRINVLAKDTFAAGTHSITWDGRDSAGRAIPSGSYLIRLETVEGVEARKVSLVR